MDEHLYTTKASPSTVLWRPKKGTSVVLDPTHYRPFSQVIRTVHLNDALEICVKDRMESKAIVTLSTLKRNVLRYYHPCKNLQVLWFGARNDDIEEDKHDWYGNVEFAVSINTLMLRWSNYYLVEMVTAPTHSITRILVTNSDYSSVLPPYDPSKYGGGWYLTPDGRHEMLTECRRYGHERYNRHGHTLEFLIEVTPTGMRKILHETELSFKNHVDAGTDRPHVCHRSKGNVKCQTPFTRAWTSRWFFKEHRRLKADRPIAEPRLSPSAEEFLHYFIAMEGIPRNDLPVLAPHPGLPPSFSICPPAFSDQHFPPLPPPACSFLISHFLQQPIANGKLRRLQMLGGQQNNMFSVIAQSLTKSKMHPDEEEEERVVTAVMACRRPLPKFLPGGPSGFPFPRYLGPPPGFPPPLHLPPPSYFLPATFQHSWTPLQPITSRRRN